ncbi:hypothetical protein JQ554_14615 [Bradyrhizobium diazoefficiens]|jgi:hypothetical protein|nr:hypothetical protein [Bradyrhizobium diazoefficiens]UCF51594.1 MAG: hypothetical protein JSV48_19520 [Bradyrhizobium sp.]MBR0964924.1 hypothetical protein [Bradyrhizobium diazoefficiens]MBR0976523.1 hypothetical protein [Bradyrhizobium diazoefficiens]MBR1008375.1 hypothetical protein [Bradyrhizobium diazoefficiens]MBR1014884.1 hypothetical protein [Bradyrhizobium diazoefficiens]
MDLWTRLLLGMTAAAVLGYISLVYGSCASDPDCHFRLCAGRRSLCGVDHTHLPGR